MPVLLTDIALNIAQILDLILVLLCYFGDIDSSVRMTSFTIFLIAFVFLGGLGLSLNLRLTLTCISRRGIVAGLSLIILMISAEFIPFGGFIALLTSGIDFSYS